MFMCCQLLFTVDGLLVYRVECRSSRELILTGVSANGVAAEVIATVACVCYALCVEAALYRRHGQAVPCRAMQSGGSRSSSLLAASSRPTGPACHCGWPVSPPTRTCSTPTPSSGRRDMSRLNWLPHFLNVLYWMFIQRSIKRSF